MAAPHRFRVVIELGYLSEPTEFETRTVDVVAYDAMQAVYQVRIAHYKEIRDSARVVERVSRVTLHERKGLTVASVEPVGEQPGG